MRTWARSRLAGAAIVALFATVSAASAQQAVLVVRHAEKADQTADSALSAAGQARAKALAELLRDAGITHIVTTEYLRTRQTAAPLAAALGLTPAQVPARDREALLATLKGLDPASIVLVVGHSNTIPAILNGLGWASPLELRDTDYDDVFVVSPRAGQRASMVRLTYGRPTP